VVVSQVDSNDADLVLPRLVYEVILLLRFKQSCLIMERRVAFAFLLQVISFELGDHLNCKDIIAPFMFSSHFKLEQIS